MSEGKSDRVTITLGRKIPAEQYGSFDLRVSYEQDREAKEKPEDCIRRVEKLVLTEMERLISIVDKAGEKVK